MGGEIPRGSDGVAPVVGVLLMVAVVLVVAVTLTVVVLGIGEDVSDPAPVADLRFESHYFGDGVAKNDSVTITHAGGDTLRRERLEIVIGDDVVYNATADSESTNQNFAVPGLVVEVDAGDEFNDLNKPCRVGGDRVSPVGTCGGPPGDGDGSDSGVVLEWAEEVQAGQRIVIQERNHPNAYDVMEPGESITVVYRGEGFSAIVDEATVAPEAASSS